MDNYIFANIRQSSNRIFLFTSTFYGIQKSSRQGVIFEKAYIGFEGVKRGSKNAIFFGFLIAVGIDVAEEIKL